MIGSNQIAELERLYERQKDAAEAFSTAVKEQAEKHSLDPQGLGKYVRAKVRDKLEKLKAEQDTVEQLALSFDGG